MTLKYVRTAARRRRVIYSLRDGGAAGRVRLGGGHTRFVVAHSSRTDENNTLLKTLCIKMSGPGRERGRMDAPRDDGYLGVTALNIETYLLTKLMPGPAAETNCAPVNICRGGRRRLHVSSGRG